jgi:hypothetical protein
MVPWYSGLLQSSPSAADRFAADDSLHRATECEQAAERIATA